MTLVSGPGEPQPNNGEPVLVLRKIRLQSKNETKEIFHYHIVGWKDQSATCEHFLAKLVTTIYNDCYSKNHHLIGHCSAGVGRTGTFFAILEAYSRLKSGQTLTPDLIDDVIKGLRSGEHGRIKMVQTVEQYALIYKTLTLL